jgi:hypothetical protein
MFTATLHILGPSPQFASWGRAIHTSVQIVLVFALQGKPRHWPPTWQSTVTFETRPSLSTHTHTHQFPVSCPQHVSPVSQHRKSCRDCEVIRYHFHITNELTNQPTPWSRVLEGRTPSCSEIPRLSWNPKVRSFNSVRQKDAIECLAFLSPILEAMGSNIGSGAGYPGKDCPSFSSAPLGKCRYSTWK